MSRAVAVAALVVVAALGPATPGGLTAAGQEAQLTAGGQHPGGPGVVAGEAGVPAPGGNGTVAVAAVYPNPVADGDRGEFVVLDVPPGTALGAYLLGDDEEVASLPNVTATGRVAVTAAPALVRNLTDAEVVEAGLPALANGGEPLRVTRAGTTVATARYRDAPEGEIGSFDDRGTVQWRPLGRTDLPVVTASGGRVRAFVLPDAPAVPVETLRRADRRVLLAGYTFTSERVTRELVRATERGVDVRVLLEGNPVGGISRREARLLDRLTAAGVSVRMLGGPRGRYAFHHAKYVVVDGRAVVLTENWKPAGTGGRASRGWGAVVGQERVVDGLARTFRADENWTGATPWTEFRRGRSFTAGGTANGSYPGTRGPETVPVERTRLLVAPDNAGREVVRVVDGATESVDVVQMRIDGPDQRFLRAVVRAARRGVDVRVLLSSAWYVREENARLVDHLRERADSEGLPIEAKLADPRGRYEKVHAKGMVVDGDQVLLGSLNWNGESVRENREVLLLLEGEDVGAYYEEAFDADWGSESPSLPLGGAAAVAGVVALAVLVLRRVEFGPGVGVDPR